MNPKLSFVCGLCLAFFLVAPLPLIAQSLRPALAPLQEIERLAAQVTALVSSSKLTEALPLAQQVVLLREGLLGSEHPQVAASLNELALIYLRQGEFTQAEPLFQRSLKIREQALGPEHPDVARTLNNLAALWTNQGQYLKAEPLLLRSLKIREQALGPEHPDVARTLSNLATLYNDQGRYIEAEPLLRRSLTVLERNFGPDHPNVGFGLNNLADLYRILGRYPQAEPLFQRALAIFETKLGADHPTVAVSLNGLADLYRDWQRYPQAEPLYRRALQIREQSLGSENPRTAQTLEDLGALSLALGRFEDAEVFLTRALLTREKVLGTDHPDVAETLKSLGRLYSAQKTDAKAEPLFRRALSIREQSLGKDHPLVSQTLDGLVLVLARSGNVKEALPLLTRSLDIQERNLRIALSSGSERQKRDYLETISGTTDIALWLQQQVAPKDPEVQRLALTTVLRRKGRLLDALSNNLNNLRRRLTPEEQILLDTLQAERAQLAALVFRGPGEETTERYRARLSALETTTEQLEISLSRTSREFARETTVVTFDTVRRQLPPGSILVEFMRYQPPGLRLEQPGPVRYAAYLLDPQGKVQSVDLGLATGIEGDLSALRRLLRDEEQPIAKLKSLARRVEARLVAPLRARLGTVRQLLIAPDGPLNLLPFAALVDQQNRFLIERYAMSYLSSGRDLLQLERPAFASSAPLIVASPFFEGGVRLPDLSSNNAIRGRGESQAVDLAGLRFDPLPGTAEEARVIAQLLPASRLLTGRDATEEAIKQTISPSILHIATHGFFLASTDASAQNPLLRSGLALAGFNRRASGREDGALTALELSSLDLRGTRLVVLSACETGLGEIAEREGVYGLRRALTLAGSEAQVVSLWQVADDATRDLMVQYYAQLRLGAGRSEGLRKAQLALLKSRAARHPYFWSAFIVSGDWRPLKSVFTSKNNLKSN